MQLVQYKINSHNEKRSHSMIINVPVNYRNMQKSARTRIRCTVIVNSKDVERCSFRAECGYLIRNVGCMWNVKICLALVGFCCRFLFTIFDTLMHFPVETIKRPSDSLGVNDIHPFGVHKSFKRYYENACSVCFTTFIYPTERSIC